MAKTPTHNVRRGWFDPWSGNLRVSVVQLETLHATARDPSGHN